jgi:hypothetical protein
MLVCTLACLAAVSGCSESHNPPNIAPAQPSQMTFQTADQAVAALVDALRSSDSTRLGSILGPDSDRVIFSGDALADQHNEQKFLQLYDEKHTLTAGDNGAMILTVGDNDWPMPIPIVTDGQVWRFDTSAGLNEILNRRIGDNELAAIQVCLAIVDAQQDYAWQNPSGDDVP